MGNKSLEQQYFDWLYKTVCEGRYSKERTYRKLFTALHDIDFTYIIPNDSNRADDGKQLRRRFAIDILNDEEAEHKILGPCSVLEMMIALAIRCETIMDDPEYGDRTKQWFWQMITNLELGGLHDDSFDIHYVESTIARFLNRDIEPDGRGGLFIVKNCEQDLRDMEIWNQLMRWLDNVY